MAAAIPNPALDAFVAQVAPELIVAEVLLQRTVDGFELCHFSDRNSESLRLISSGELRRIAQFTEHQQFRPLKSAPNLRRGWRCVAHSSAELEFALQCLYPGGLADWCAAQRSAPPITHYRDFVKRQTGMYRLTAMLNDEQVAQMARAGCDKRFCLKRRLWTATGLAADGPAEKSLIPCLEPCALLLEFARTVARLEQEQTCSLLAAPQIEALKTALHEALLEPFTEVREGDFAKPNNPRRAQWLLNKLEALSRKERQT